MKIDRPAIRYYGGKWRIGEWIISQFPPHSCYVEPFAGGASVLLQKAPAKFEVLNDLNKDVIAFFDQLRENPDRLIRAIQLTPYGRAELERARKPTTDPFEQARRFYVRCWQSYGSGVGRSSTGWRYQIGAGDNSRASAVGSWSDTDHLWAVAERLKSVQIDCDDALKVMTRYDSAETLFYLDPPYVHKTRYHNSPSKGYAFEMSDSDHRLLAEAVAGLKGMAIISGYPSELYAEIFSSWRQISRDTTDLNGKKQVESLWLSPRTVALAHLPLFAGGL